MDPDIWERGKKRTYLILPAAHLPPLVLLPLPHVLEEQPPATLLGVLAPLEERVGAGVARGKAEFVATVIAGTEAIVVAAAEY
jgi:hypothetical protein